MDINTNTPKRSHTHGQTNKRNTIILTWQHGPETGVTGQPLSLQPQPLVAGHYPGREMLIGHA